MSRDPDGKLHCCEKCRYAGDLIYRKDLDEYWCEDCITNENEVAWDRYQESLMEGGGPPSLKEQMAEARKLK